VLNFERNKKPRRGPLRVLWGKFVAGLVIVVPIVITFQALYWLFLSLDGLAGPLANTLVGHEIPGLGFVTTIAVVFVTGLLFSAGPLKRLLDGFEEVVVLIPVVGVVYGTIKKVFEGFGSLRSTNAFKRFVLARLPGRTTPGFLTGSFVLRAEDGTERRLATVYIPSNHLWFGDIVVLAEEDIIETDVPIEDGISMLLSAGAAVPATITQVGARGLADPVPHGGAERIPRDLRPGP
jgi:uncharacterized membrane protein